jgi:hypothetical protein
MVAVEDAFDIPVAVAEASVLVDQPGGEPGGGVA